jgi:hypothetical protein
LARRRTRRDRHRFPLSQLQPAAIAFARSLRGALDARRTFD